MRTIQVNDIEVQAEQLGPSGHAIWDRTNFVAHSSRPLTTEEVHEIQTELGYSPYGYGCFYMPNSRYHELKDNMYITSWCCSGSCA